MTARPGKSIILMSYNACREGLPTSSGGGQTLFCIVRLCKQFNLTFNTRSYEFICWIANEYQRINQVRMVLFLSGDIHEGI